MKTLLQPRNWFFILAGLLPFERIPAVPVLGFHLRPSLIAALIFVVLALIDSPKLLVPKRLAHWLLYLFLGICLLSSSLSTHPERAFMVTFYTALAALLALCIASIIKEINLRTLGYVLLGSSLVVAVFGFYQFVADLMGVSVHLTGLKPMYSSQVFGFPRIQAASLEPLYFGNYLLLIISILTSIGLIFGINIITLTLLFTAILLTLSRGAVGVAAMIVSVFLALALYKRQYNNFAKISIALVISLTLTFCALMYLVPALHKPIPGTPKQSAVSVYSDQVTNLEIGNNKIDRALTRQLAINAFISRPILGIGPGNYGYYAAAKAGYDNHQIANNEPLELLAETGLIGLLSFVSFAIVLGRDAIKRILVRDNDLLSRAVLFGALVYLIGTAIQYYSFSTLYIIQVWFAIGLVMGLSVHLPKAKKTAKP